MGFQNKTVLIIGGTKGIGLQVAISAATRGANVIIGGRNAPQALPQTEQGNIEFVKCDVSNETDVAAIVDHSIKKYGRLDMAFNNAGITSSFGKLANSSSDEWKQVLDINLNGIYYSLKHEILAMKDRGGGSIVNMSSAAGVLPIGMQAAYVTSKSAVIALTRSAASDYAANSSGPIRINAIAPGPIIGGMNTQEKLDADPEKTAKKIAVTAMRRFGTSEEVAHSVLWLLSPESSYVTGTVLSVDGGYSAGKI